MSKSSGAGIGPFLIAFVFFLGISYGWQKISVTLRGFGMPPALIGFVGVALLATFLLSMQKRALVASMPESIALVSANPKDYPWLEHETLAHLSVAMESLGFVPVQDFTVQSKATWPQSFARLFYDASLSCYAEVNQVNAAACRGIECTILSYFGDDWSLSSTTRVPLIGTWTFRKPKAVWSAHPFVDPAQLLQAHLSWRENMTYHLGVNVLQGGSFEAYERVMMANHDKNREIVRRKPIALLMLDRVLYSMNPKMEWKGIYPRIAAQRAKQHV